MWKAWDHPLLRESGKKFSRFEAWFYIVNVLAFAGFMIRAGNLSCEVSVVAEKPYYRPDELARAVDVSVDTVRRWLNRGLVEHIHLLGVIRIPRSEFVRVLRDGIGEKSAKNR